MSHNMALMYGCPSVDGGQFPELGKLLPEKSVLIDDSYVLKRIIDIGIESLSPKKFEWLRKIVKDLKKARNIK